MRTPAVALKLKEARLGGLRMGRPGEQRLPERDLDVGDLKLIEKPFAIDGRGLGILAGKRLGALRRSKEWGSGVLFDFGEADNIDGRPRDVDGI